MKESIHPFIYSIFSISSLVVKIAKKIVVGTLILQNWTFWSVKYLEGGGGGGGVKNTYQRSCGKKIEDTKLVAKRTQVSLGNKTQNSTVMGT